MVAKNDIFLTNLSDSSKVKSLNRVASTHALDALIKVDPTDPIAFRQGILDHIDIWDSLTGIDWTHLQKVNDKPDEVKSRGFLDDQDTVNTFKKIRQKAVEQRIKLGLTDFNNQDLMKVLASTNDEIRQYLATKITIGNGALQDIPGWNTPADVLTDDAINQIKIEAKILSDLRRAKLDFIAHIHTASHAEILEYQSLLESNDFLGELVTINSPYKALSLGDVDEIKELLAVRYLKEKLVSGNNLDIVNQTILNNFIVEMITDPDGCILTNRPLLNKVVTDDNWPYLRNKALQGVISHHKTSTQLAAIYNAKDLTTFRAKLQAIGVNPTDWVTSEHQKEMQKTACMRVFELKSSQFKAGSHLELVEGFRRLSFEQQRNILKSDMNIVHLQHAKSSDAIKYYFGRDADVQNIVDENNRLSQINGIHNAGVAKILANFKPPISFVSGDGKIDLINSKFVNAGVYKPLDFASVADYKIFVDALKDQCSPVDDKDFYSAFGLNDDGSAYLDENIKDTIQQQHKRNKWLLNDYYHPNKEEYKGIYGLFLSQKKEKKIVPSVIKQIADTFNASEDKKQFINNSIPLLTDLDTSQQNNLKRSLTIELTSDIFLKTKSAVNKPNLANTDTTILDPTIKSIETQISEDATTRKNLNKIKPKLEKLPEIDAQHIINKQFHKTKQSASELAQLRQDFVAVGNDCTLTLQHLYGEKAALAIYLDSLPTAYQDSTHKQKIVNLKTKINKEQAAVNEDISFYERVQHKISNPTDGVLKRIDEEKGNTQDYMAQFMGTGVHKTVKTIDASALSAYVSKHNNTSLLTTIQVQGLQYESKAVDPLQGGDKIRVHDTAYDFGAGGQQMKGRVLERLVGTPKTTVHNGKSTVTQDREFVVDKFPSSTGNPEPTADDLQDARIKYALDAAWSAMQTKPKDGKFYITAPSGKQDEALHMVYALLALGADKSNLVLMCGDFNLSKELGWGFKKSKLHSTFVNHPLVQNMKSGIKQYSADKTRHNTEKHIIQKGIREVTDLFKGEVGNVKKLGSEKEKIEKKIADEGPAQKGPTF
jgi:hypothetical protein